MAIMDRLSDTAQRQKALLQDKALEIIFSSSARAVFHGGTCIWRCYGGERFSKDIDIYVKNKPAIEKMLNKLKITGLSVHLLQERKADFGLYRNYIIRSAFSDIALQVTFSKIKGTLVDYETINGAYRNVIALSAEGILLEKLDALLDRSKARDLYDIWILSRYQFSKSVADKLKRELSKKQKILDYEELRHTVYGLLPNIAEMQEAILRRIDEIRK